MFFHSNEPTSCLLEIIHSLFALVHASKSSPLIKIHDVPLFYINLIFRFQLFFVDII